MLQLSFKRIRFRYSFKVPHHKSIQTKEVVCHFRKKKLNSFPLILTMVTSKKPRLNHRLVYKEHNPSASQSFISTVILEKKRNNLHKYSSSTTSGSRSFFWSPSVLILCLTHFVSKIQFRALQ